MKLRYKNALRAEMHEFSLSIKSKVNRSMK